MLKMDYNVKKTCEGIVINEYTYQMLALGGWKHSLCKTNTSEPGFQLPVAAAYLETLSVLLTA